ncbi:MAG: zinc ribbon domain-containing protein [Chloracidobacterium sp.]|nr:zinc ribbon domain-containing protein [Chloracidobacterium sp.]
MMSQRPCDKCGEEVSVTKAFCPACGHALVDEEQREDTSEFQRLDGTMQVGKTMYNQMLSEMGLNISVPSEQLTEAEKPILNDLAPAASPKSPTARVGVEVIKPIGKEKLAPAASAASPRMNRTKLLLIIGAVIIAGWVLVGLLIAFFAILPRLR